MLTESQIQQFTEQATDVFPGFTYTNASRIPSNMLKIKAVGGRMFNKLDPRWYLSTAVRKKLQPKFLIGYEMQDTGVKYEVWFAPERGRLENYVLVSSAGEVIRSDSRLKEILDNVQRLVSTIELSSFQQPKNITKLIENAVTTRDALVNSFNREMRQYNFTRIRDHKVRDILGYAGEKVYYPKTKRAWFFRLFGKKTRMDFVIGFAYGDIMYEIWQVDDAGTESFNLYNLTSGQLIAERLNTLRDAYAAISEHARASKLPEYGRFTRY